MYRSIAKKKMKKDMLKAVVLTVVLACTVSISMAQQSTRDAIKYAESVNFDGIFNSQIDLEQCSYIQENNIILSIIQENSNLLSIAKYKGATDGLISSGSHTLHLNYTDPNDKSSRYIRMITEHRQFNFEAGKSYHFALRKSEKYEWIIEEDSDSKVEYIKAFMEYTEANPDRMNGTWNCEKKHSLNTFLMQYTIEGNRIVFEGKNKRIDRPFVAEGRLLYNENIIIMFPEKATNNGREVENFDREPKYVWYYTLTNDVLRIEGGRRFGNLKGLGLVWENTGEFRKTR